MKRRVEGKDVEKETKGMEEVKERKGGMVTK